MRTLMQWILAGITGLLLAPAHAQTQRLPRIAYVWLFDAGPSAPYQAAFAERLDELGWKDGKNVRSELYDAKGDMKKLEAIMNELARSKVDIIVAMCTPEAKAARKATSTIPIVVAAAGDLAAAGLLTSYARPGGNITGVSTALVDAGSKRVEYLKKAFPSIRKATVLWNPHRPDNQPEVQIMMKAATQLGFQIQSVQVRTREELITALEMLQVDGTEAILNAGDTLLTLEAPMVARRAAELRVPAIHTERVFPDNGGLMSYGPNSPQMHRLAAEYVDKILRGAKPGDLPIQQPTRFELVVNRKVAKSQGFRLPENLLLRADDVLD